MPTNKERGWQNAASTLIAAGLDYGASRANQGRKRSAKKSGGGGSSGGKGTRGSTATIHSHGITGNLHVVQVVKSFDALFSMQSSPGVHVYGEPTIAKAVGRLEDFTPLAARAKVRFSFASNAEVNVTWPGCTRLITAKRYTTPWMDLHVAQPLRLTQYGAEVPHGEFTIECAGLINWDAELQNRSVPFSAGPRAKPRPAQVKEQEQDEEVSSEEDEPVAKTAPTSPVKPVTPPRQPQQANVSAKRT